MMSAWRSPSDGTAAASSSAKSGTRSFVPRLMICTVDDSVSAAVRSASVGSFAGSTPALK
jgi:hypothetical protein